MKRQGAVVALALALGGGVTQAAPAADSMDGKVAAPAAAEVKNMVKDALKDATKGVVQGAAAAAAEGKNAAVAAGQNAAAAGAAVAGPVGPDGKAAPAAAAVPANDPAARAAALRRKALKDDDFIETDDNRDPFRSYLRLFIDKGVQPVRKVPAIFEKFALEELTLIGIVSGDANPRAMFRDPAGLGLTIKRGDYVSKVGARVTKILSDRVILELSEITAAGEARPLEKAILVNPEEAQNK